MQAVPWPAAPLALNTVLACDLTAESSTLTFTPLFHTGDERYAWLNRIQAVAKGTFTPEGTLIYEMYELR